MTDEKRKRKKPADRPTLEITPEMVEAAEDYLFKFLGHFQDLGPSDFSELAEGVLAAAIRAKPPET